MRECESVLERLPELLHERLPAVERERVLAHVRGCAACETELAWLRTMREGIVAAAPRVDVAAIARGVHAKLAAAPTLRLVTAEEETAPIVRGTLPVSRRRWASAGMRAAAALAVVAAGAASVLVARRAPDAPPAVAVGTPSASSTAAQTAPSTPSAPPAPMQVASAEPGAPLGVSLADLSDDELAAVIAAIDDEGGTLPADPAPAIPVVTSGGTP